MLDTWLMANLPSDSVRQFGVFVRRVFGGIGEQQIVALLTQLKAGGPLLEWEGRFSQLTREGVTGTEATTGFNALLTGQQPLTGAQLNTFWAAALGTTGGSELVMRCVWQLSSTPNPLSGQQIRDLILLFLNGTACPGCAHPRLILSKSQLLTALTDLRSKFTPQQVWTFCLFFQADLPADLPAKLPPGPPTRAGRFLAICRDVRATTRTGHDLILAITTHGNLTNPQLAALLFLGSFEYTLEFLATGLPPVPLPNGVVGSPSLLSYAISKGTTAAVAGVLAQAAKADVPCTVTARLFIHLRRMTAGDKVERLAKFIEEAGAAREVRGQKRKHTWVEIMALVDLFVADNRHLNSPNAVQGGALIVEGSCRCTGERVRYFVKAHTYGWFDFTIVDRSRDDITLFPQGTTDAGMRGLVQNVLAQVDDDTVKDVLASNTIHISTEDYAGSTYEIGLIKQRDGVTVALIHFMPFTLDPADYWHKDLLGAVGWLF
jgi:hypothetical protein